MHTPMTVDEFAARFGRQPEMDDLERVNCHKAGEPMHRQCGICPTHERPRFECGCRPAPSPAPEAK